MSREIVTANGLLNGLNILHSFGYKRGDSTGWRCVDEHYTVQPGQLTVVTGWPGSGKSEWLDAMLLNLTRSKWHFAIFSPENRPTHVHVAKMIEKWAGKPFGQGPHERLTWDEIKQAADAIDDYFAFLQPEAETPAIIDVLMLAQRFFETNDHGMKRGLVIDPWNELDHMRPSNLTETEYVSQTLSLIRNWARAWECHVWIVAHPAKQRREDGKLPTPRPDMIAGSQHWWNKADNCIAVQRNYDDADAPVDILIQKIRFKHIGRIGTVSLHYDRVTGQYSEPRQEGNVIYSFERSRA